MRSTSRTTARQSSLIDFINVSAQIYVDTQSLIDVLWDLEFSPTSEYEMFSLKVRKGELLIGIFLWGSPNPDFSPD